MPRHSASEHSPGGGVAEPPAANDWASRVLGRFSRITSGQKLIPEIDGLRFLAIAAVFLHHANTLAVRACADAKGVTDEAAISAMFEESLLTAILQKGWVGVDVFFAISGFILGLPFARHLREGAPRVPLAPYFARRLSRLEVPYLASLLLAFTLGGLMSGDFPWGPLAASCLYVHGFVYGDHSAVNPVAWSLEIEVQFYCLAPLLALVFLPERRATRLAIMLLASAASIILRHWFRRELEPWHLHDCILVYLHLFFTGFIAVEFQLQGSKVLRWLPPRACDALGVLGIAALFSPIRLHWAAESIIFMPACLMVFLSAMKGDAVRAAFRNRWVVTIGGMCYSIYLLHYGAMTVAAGRIGTSLAGITESLPGTVLVFVVAMAPVALVPSAIFFALVERPCMRRGWFMRLLGMDRRGTPGPA